MYSGIFSKLDWYTCMFQNCSIYDVLDLFGCKFDADIAEIFASHYSSSKGYSSDVIFQFAGLNIRTDIRDIYIAHHTEDVDSLGADVFFGSRLENIRLDISGQGLDWIRSQGIVPETFFRTPYELKEGQSYHVTRADFAFDFLDTHENFLTDLIALCERLDTGNGVCTGDCRPTKYSVHSGDQLTLYLGAARSNKRLRVYDKGMQFTQSKKAAFDHPYFDESDSSCPSSWIRVELQSRNEVSRMLLGSTESSEQVLRYIFDNFSMREKGSKFISDVWLSLWDWSLIPSIIQNENSAIYIDPLKRAESFCFGSAFISILTYINAYGFDSFKEKILEELQHMQTSQSPSSVFRMRSLLMRCNDLAINHPDKLPHLRSIGGVLTYINFN